MKKLFQNQRPINLLTVLLIMICFQFFFAWVFVGFLHYKSQNRVLPASTFTVEVVTAEDLQLLADRSQYSVTLSNGTTIADRQPSFYEHSLPNYVEANGGEHYVQVTALGTSPFYARWFSDFLPLFVMSLIALGFACAELKWQERQREVEEASGTS